MPEWSVDGPRLWFMHGLLGSRTWPHGVVGVAQVLWRGEEHLIVGDRGPEGNHVVAFVVADGGVLVRVHGLFCWRGGTENERLALSG